MFTSDRDGNAAFKLYLIKPDATGLRQLTDNQWEDATATWMPEVADRQRTAR